MIDYSSNIGDEVAKKLAQMEDLKNNPDPVLRTVALAVLPALLIRVHTDGKDSEGNQIGTYSPGYMALRTGNYQNSGKFSKGAKKGQLKDSGVFTKRGTTFFTQVDEETVSSKKAFLKTENEKKARPNYHRTSDTKVILSLTRQMELDTSVVQTPNGYGIGYLNPFNFQKALWCEETYHKKILTELTDGEKDLAQTTAENFIIDYLKTS